MANEKDPKEIVSLSKELMSFDLNDVSVEELERRLELAVAEIIPGGIDFDCPSNCGTVCGVRCGTMCGTDCTTLINPGQP